MFIRGPNLNSIRSAFTSLKDSLPTKLVNREATPAKARSAHPLLSRLSGGADKRNAFNYGSRERPMQQDSSSASTKNSFVGTNFIKKIRSMEFGKSQVSKKSVENMRRELRESSGSLENEKKSKKNQCIDDIGGKQWKDVSSRLELYNELRTMRLKNDKKFDMTMTDFEINIEKNHKHLNSGIMDPKNKYK